MRRKLGKEIVDRYRVVNHNCFTRNTKTYSRPNGGPDFSINRIVADAGLKIAVSGILSHGGAGFGGGGKAILPSVASYETIRYNHETFEWEGYGIVYPKRIKSRSIRKDIEICTGVVGLDYSVNVLYSPRKEVLGVFSGHYIDAHREGSKAGRRLFLTTPPGEKLDIVIADGYPLDTDIGQSHRGTWPEKYGKKSVLMGGARDGWAYHGDNGKSYRIYQQMRRERKAVEGYRFKGTQHSKDANVQSYFSPTITEEQFYERDVKRRFYNHWEALIADFDGNGRKKSVGIFPYASMQVEGIANSK